MSEKLLEKEIKNKNADNRYFSRRYFDMIRLLAVEVSSVPSLQFIVTGSLRDNQKDIFYAKRTPAAINSVYN